MPPGVLDVDDLWKTTSRELHNHKIEPVGILGLAESGDPDHGPDRDALPLPPPDRVEASTKGVRLPSFDFQEGNQIALTGHQVEIGMAKAEAVSQDRPPPRFEIAGGGKLPGETPPVARISPLGKRTNDVGH